MREPHVSLFIKIFWYETYFEFQIVRNTTRFYILKYGEIKTANGLKIVYMWNSKFYQITVMACKMWTLSLKMQHKFKNINSAFFCLTIFYSALISTFSYYPKNILFWSFQVGCQNHVLVSQRKRMKSIKYPLHQNSQIHLPS